MKIIHSYLTGIGAAIIGAVLASVALYVLQEREQYFAHRDLVTAFMSDIKAMEVKEAERLKTWPELMHRLSKFDQKHDEARPWLMPEAIEPSGFVVFEQNVGNLGLLDAALAEQISQLYSQSEMLRAEVRMLASPEILFAGKKDKDWLIKRNKKTQKVWNDTAKKMLSALADDRKKLIGERNRWLLIWD